MCDPLNISPNLLFSLVFRDYMVLYVEQRCDKAPKLLQLPVLGNSSISCRPSRLGQ